MTFNPRLMARAHLDEGPVPSGIAVLLAFLAVLTIVAAVVFLAVSS